LCYLCGQRPKEREQNTGDRGQLTEIRGQKSEDRVRNTEVRDQKIELENLVTRNPELIDLGIKMEDL